MPGNYKPQGIRRTKAEMVELDSLILEVRTTTGFGARRIAQALAERLGKPVDDALVVRRMRRHGIHRSALEGLRATQPVPEVPVPFSRREGDMPNIAQGRAISWFIERGYNVSLPVQTTSYDLVVESDEGLKRIQVKSTESRNDKSASWRVNICRGHGRNRSRGAYSKGDLDLFFILTGSGDVYLIPIEAVEGKERICLDVLYKRYRQK